MAFLRRAGNLLARNASNCLNAKPSVLQALRCMSSSKLFVGGLSYGTDDMSLREAFCKYGDVAEARVIVDRDTGRSRGFGFVTYSSEEEASAAIQALDQQDLQGRRIRVDYANDRTRGYGDGSGAFRGGGNFGGGYGQNNAGGYGGGYGDSQQSYGSFGDQNFGSGDFGGGGQGHQRFGNDRGDEGGFGFGQDQSFDDNKYADGRN